MTTTSSSPAFAAFIGLDWADRKHDVCLRAAGQEKTEHKVLTHTPEALDAWAIALRERFNGQPIAICLELSRGPIVAALQKHDFFVIFPINPATLAKYRQAFTPSRAKDDPTDAELALDFLLRHREHLKRLQPQSATMRALQQLVAARRMLVDDGTRIINRLTAALKGYFPQVLGWFQHRNTVIFCDFLSRWSSLQSAKRARKTTLRAFFHNHNVRYDNVIDARITKIRDATPLTTDPGIIEPAQLLVETLAPQLKALLEAVKRYDDAIAERCAVHDDFHLFESLPGAGKALAPRLLAAFGEQRDRFASAGEVQQYTGIAPVTERSGQKSWVHWRMRCPTFQRQTFVEWAGQTVVASFWAGAYYRQQRERGHRHQAAIRSLAFKWIRILFRCWKDGVQYDENTYLKMLRKKGSPLLANMASATI
jgi:transposase